MRVINKTTQNDILKRIAECQIIAQEYFKDDFDTYKQISEHLASIAHDIGGNKGSNEVGNVLFTHLKDRSN